MLEFLAAFSVQQIIVYGIMLCLAIKGGVDFFAWAKEKYEKKFNADHAKLNKEEMLEEHYKKCEQQHIEAVGRYNSLEEKIDLLTETVNQKVDKIEAQLTQLTESDMHDIKGWIVEKHHQIMKNGWVDDFTMDTLEKRYADYQIEGGNSYVAGLMSELRALPHFPPEQQNNI